MPARHKARRIGMDTFWRLFEKSTVTTFAITLGVLGTCCYLWASQNPVPELLQGAMWVVLGYFMGAKGQIELRNYKAKKAS